MSESASRTDSTNDISLASQLYAFLQLIDAVLHRERPLVHVLSGQEMPVERYKLPSPGFFILAENQTGTDLRVCDLSNTGSCESTPSTRSCAFHASSPPKYQVANHYQYRRTVRPMHHADVCIESLPWRKSPGPRGSYRASRAGDSERGLCLASVVCAVRSTEDIIVFSVVVEVKAGPGRAEQ